MEMHQMWSIGRHICSISHFPGKVIVKYNPYNFNRNRKAIRLVYELYLDKTHLVVTYEKSHLRYQGLVSEHTQKC